MPPATKKCSGPCKQTRSRLEFYNDRSQLDGKSRRCIYCVKEARRVRSGNGVAGETKMDLSDEERQRRSDLAKQLHEEGKLGGSENGKKGGRPPVKSITEAVIEEFQEDVDPVIDALKAGLASDSDSTRVRAVQVLTGLEQQVEERRFKARGGGKPLEEMSREELRETILEGVRKLQEQGQFEDPAAGSVDGEAEEMEPEELEPAAAT